MRLSDRLKQDHFTSAAQEAMLSVLVTSAWVGGEVAAALAPFDLTPAQYNVLRILRGSHPQPLPCSAIGERLLDRTPDVTRLLDRLAKAGFLSRARAAQDRRVVEVHVTAAGLRVLAEAQPGMDALETRLGGVLTEEEYGTLCALLERMRVSETPVPADLCG